MKFKVKITEKLVKVVEVEAESEEEALEKVEDDYYSEKIILYPDDFTEMEMVIADEEEE